MYPVNIREKEPIYSLSALMYVPDLGRIQQILILLLEAEMSTIINLAAKTQQNTSCFAGLALQCMRRGR